MQELLGEFIEEAHENLDEMDRLLLSLSQDSSNCAAIEILSRILHNIKGASSFLDVPKLQELLH